MTEGMKVSELLNMLNNLVEKDKLYLDFEVKLNEEHYADNCDGFYVKNHCLYFKSKFDL